MAREFHPKRIALGVIACIDQVDVTGVATDYRRCAGDREFSVSRPRQRIVFVKYYRFRICRIAVIRIKKRAADINCFATERVVQSIG